VRRGHEQKQRSVRSDFVEAKDFYAGEFREARAKVTEAAKKAAEAAKEASRKAQQK
jgi:hypothetical protein